MPKKDVAPTPTPAPRSEKPSGKTITMDLRPEQAQQLRQLATRTGMTQAYLRSQLSRSEQVGAAITGELRRAYEKWKEGLADDLFAGPIVKEEKGGPDV